MTNQDFHRPSSHNSTSGSNPSGDLMSKASELAGDAASKVKQTASDTAASIAGEVKQLLDQQVSGGASMVGHLASSAMRAADDLDRESPQLAGVVRAFANRMDGYASNLQNQSVDELVKSASDFTRRQPALMFGLAALAGFFVMRTLKSSPTGISLQSSPSLQPSQPAQGQTKSSFHGT